jgi:type IV pilus assembly protein PilF
MTIWLRAGSSLILAVLLAACVSSPAPRNDEPAGDDKAALINVQLGAAYLERGDLELANVKLERALKQDPQLATAHWTYALLQAQLGRAERAEKHFREAIKLDPEDSRAHNNFGVFLCNAGRLEEAQEQFEQALKNPLYDQPETALTNAGVCALKVPAAHKAEAYFKRALEHNPRFAPAVYELARLAFAQEDYPQARDYLQRVQELTEHNASTLLLAVQIEWQLGNRGTAASYAAQLKNKYPDSRQAAELRELERGGS